jgi:hypothetical protein
MNTRKQFQVKLPNKPGQLAYLGEALGNKGINIVSIAGLGEETPFVVIVTEKEEETRNLLKDMRLKFKEREPLMAKIPDKPGELGKLAKRLADAKINIESVYLLGKEADMGVIGFTVDNTEGAKKILGLSS